MGDVIKVIPEEVLQTAEKVKAKADEYWTAYQALIKEVDSLTETGFQGEAANAYREKVRSYEKDFNKMRELMERYGTVLKQNTENYIEAQKRAVNATQSIGGR